MNLLDEYKELYYRENEFEEKLNAKSNASLTLLTILGTGQIIMWDEMFFAKWNLVHLIYFIVCIISFLIFCKSIYLFLKAYHNYTYKRFPIKATKNCVDISNEKSKNNKKLADALVKYQEKLFLQQYIDCAIYNREVNLKKNLAQKKLTKWLIILFCITIACFIFKTTLFKIYCPLDSVYKVEMTGGDNMCDEEKDGFPPIPPAEMINESFAELEPKAELPQASRKIETGTDE